MSIEEIASRDAKAAPPLEIMPYAEPR